MPSTVWASEAKRGGGGRPTGCHKQASQGGGAGGLFRREAEEEVVCGMGQSPVIFRQVLYNPVQNFLDERCAYPYVFQGLWAEGWGLPAGRALSPQGLLVAS